MGAEVEKAGEGEEIVDPEIYIEALREAEDIVRRVMLTWEHLRDVYEELERRVRADVRMVDLSSAPDWNVVAVDSTYSPTLSLRGFRSGFVLLAAVFYPDGRRPIFRLRRVREPLDAGEDEEPLLNEISYAAKVFELEFLRDLLAEAEGYQMVVRDGDLPPVEAIFQKRRLITDLAHDVLIRSKETGIGVTGIVKRISTSLIAFKYLGGELRDLLERGWEGVSRYNVLDMLSDPVVGWMMLDPGEFLRIGRFGDNVDGEPFIVKYFDSVVRRKGSKYVRRMENLLRERPEFGDIEVGFYRPSFPGAPLVKLMTFNTHIEEFAKYCMLHTSGPSYPDFLNLADIACIEHARTLRPELIMVEALRVAASKGGLDKVTFRGRHVPLLGIQNVQKLHLFFRGE